MAQQRVKSLCVFCGSSKGASPTYIGVAEELGRLMAERNMTLVYGGGSLGVMGALARSVQHNGGHVIGVIPHALHGFDTLMGVC
jgi:hypothetical protein